MFPQEKQAINVQKILNSPVKAAEQKPLLPPKESWLGWLSYVGYTLSVVLIFTLFLIRFYEMNSSAFRTPIYLDHMKIIALPCIAIGVILSVIVIWKAPYSLSSKVKKVILGFLLIFALASKIFMHKIAQDSMVMLEYNILRSIIALCFFLLFWYMHYFYQKSNAGYHRVWKKVILFTIIPLIIPFLPLFFWEDVEANVFMNGDIID